MKNAKRFLSVMLIFAFLFTFSGCNLISVNKEKDRKRVVAKVDDKEIYKGEIDDYINFLEIMYDSYGYQFSEDKDEVKQIKEGILDAVVEYNVLKLNKENVQIDEKEIKKDVDDTLEAMKEAFSQNGQTSYEDAINQKGYTEESFYDAVYNYTLLSNYTQKFSEDFINSENANKYTLSTVLKVDDEEIPAYYFYYYMVQEEVSKYLGSSSMPTDEKELKEIKEGIIDNLTENACYIKEGKAQKIQLTEEEINNKKQSVNVDSYYGKDSVLYLANEKYCMSEDEYDKALTWVATASLYKEKLVEKAVGDSIKDSDIEKYFKKNKNKFDESTVSAMHILVDDKATAKEIYSNIINSGKTFEEMVEEYSNYEEVKAEDLGPFTYPDMVENFSKAAFGMKVGEISKPVQTEYGYHIIYVYDKYDAGEPKLKDNKEEVRKLLLEEKKADEEEKYTKSLVKKAKVSDEKLIDSPFDTYMNELKEKFSVKEYKKILLK